MGSIRNDTRVFTDAGLMARKSRHLSDFVVGQLVTTK